MLDGVESRAAEAFAGSAAAAASTAAAAAAASTVVSAPVSLLDVARSELGWGADLGWRRPPSARPSVGGGAAWRRALALERFLCFGACLCADLVLAQAALLPLRAARAAAGAGVGAAARLTRLRAPAWVRRAVTRAGLLDLVKAGVVAAATAALGQLQVSRVYHYVRGEAIIKLYVIFNILDIVDKLLGSTGVDVWDGLYRALRDDGDLAAAGAWLAGGDGDGDDGGDRGSGGGSDGGGGGTGAGGGAGAAPPKRRYATLMALARLAVQVALAVGYVTLHACVIFVQIVCLNVALNSRNNALLTLLVSNNFVELKSCVFKRYEPANLFAIACADAVERFTLALFLGLILLQEGAAAPLLTSAAVMWAAELAVDGIKHAFVTSFNRLPARLYASFAAVAARDYVAVRGRMRTSLDPTHAVVRRMGLAPLPLLCVLLRIGLTHAGPWLRRAVTTPIGLLTIALALLCLVLAKLSLGMALLTVATRIVHAQREQHQAPMPAASVPPEADEAADGAVDADDGGAPVALPATVAAAAAAAAAASLGQLAAPVAGLRQRHVGGAAALPQSPEDDAPVVSDGGRREV